LSFTKEQFPSLHRFSLEQYYELGELGLLDRRTELLDGVIIDMEPVSPWHANIGDIPSVCNSDVPLTGKRHYAFKISRSDFLPGSRPIRLRP